MTLRAIQNFTTFAVAILATLIGVFFFFNPVASGDTSFVSVHPAIAVVVYVGLSTWLFIWAAGETRSAYKAAFVVAAPQAILILDLAFRGNRGLITALAGILLLIFTWITAALTYSRFDRGKNAL